VNFLANSAGTLASVAVLVLAAGVLYRREDLEVALKWRHPLARARADLQPHNVHLIFAI
jgi:hypothetical protein